MPAVPRAEDSSRRSLEQQNPHTTATPPITPAPLAVSVNELCGMIGVSRSVAYQLCRDGRIKTVRIGRRYCVPISSINTFLTSDATH